MSSKSVAGHMTLEILYLIAGRESPYVSSYSRTPVTRKLGYLHRRGYVTGKGETYSLTQQGRDLLTEEIIWSLKIPTPQKWDKKWRMVLFDIPVKKLKQRNAFRARLKELGLVLYQHSVWVYPYPLEETVRSISDFYRISDCVLFAVAEQLNGEKKLRKQFGLM